MKVYKVEFTANGKINKHGITFVTELDIDDVLNFAVNKLHNVLDGNVFDYEIISVSLIDEV